MINQNLKCFMASLDVDSIFTNVLLHETIKTCIDELFKSELTVSDLEIFEMFSLSLKESIILFDKSQIEGVVMGSRNIFLSYHDSNWLKDCLKDFKPVYYKRFGNDIRKNIFTCLFSVHNTISLSRHEQVCLMR